MKLKTLLHQRKEIKPTIKHVCKPTGLLIGSNEKELIVESLKGLREVLVDRLKEYETRETTFQGFQRMQKEYQFLQLQVQTIDAIEKKIG